MPTFTRCADGRPSRGHAGVARNGGRQRLRSDVFLRLCGVGVGAEMGGDQGKQEGLVQLCGERRRVGVASDVSRRCVAACGRVGDSVTRDRSPLD